MEKRQPPIHSCLQKFLTSKLGKVIERIAEACKREKKTGRVSVKLRDESDKDGMRIVLSFRRGEIQDVVVNN